MNNKSFQTPHAGFKNRSLGQWIGKETHRDLILPYSIATARERLEDAFSSPITVSSGFLFSKYRYNGRIESNRVEMDFSVPGRSRMYYRLDGQLSDHADGMQLTFVVKHETSLFFLLTFLAVMIGCILLSRDAPIVLVIPLIVIMILAMMWHLNSAANNVSGLLTKIISGFSIDD